MALVALTQEAQQKRETFLRIIFHNQEGYVCIARIRREDKLFSEAFYQIPAQWDELLMSVQDWTPLHDVYFCPMIFKKPQRIKENVGKCPVIWADLDECHPDLLKVKPSIVVVTSPSRYQALWRLVEPLEPAAAEDMTRRIAYAHAEEGADTTGWDLTQYLRIPFTLNHKYVTATSPEPPMVHIGAIEQKTYVLEDFNEEYPQVEPPIDRPIPTQLPEGGNAEELLRIYGPRLHVQALNLFQTEPGSNKWSQALWHMQMLLFEGGMSPEEVFTVAQDAACNKFRRDGFDAVYLWKDVLRAHQRYELTHKAIPDSVTHQPLLTDEERQIATKYVTIVEEYVEWGKSLGDAAWEYHQAGAFVCLSSLLAGPVRLPTSFGMLVPNLWFMILADTTLTRKTTAMDIAMDIITEIDADAVLATDGSIEGLFSSLSTRPARPSIFLRDEFSGLLEMIGKKDYYAGMAETLTKMYDGKYQKRVLRREIIEVKEPVLIMFAGGIRERVLSLLTYEHVASGFIPRFVFISADSNVAGLRALGPPTEEVIEKRYDLVMRFAEMHRHYNTTTSMTVNGKTSTSMMRFDAKLTPEAWARYNKFEADMLVAGLDSYQKELVTPTFDRLAKTGLKMAVLLAAARQMGSGLTVELKDILKAISYIERWRDYSAMVINSVGRTGEEKRIERVRIAVRDKPGVLRSELMLVLRLTAREADAIFSTLDQRNQISRVRSGRTEKLFPIQ